MFFDQKMKRFQEYQKDRAEAKRLGMTQAAYKLLKSCPDALRPMMEKRNRKVKKPKPPLAHRPSHVKIHLTKPQLEFLRDLLRRKIPCPTRRGQELRMAINISNTCAAKLRLWKPKKRNEI